MTETDVLVYVANLNTVSATELCIRTAHKYAGRPFRLVVGDSGSTDGSLAMLRKFERKGWLILELAPEGRRHAQWLDRWSQECPAQYAVFVDSDMEFLRDNWLDDLVNEARTNNAAMVTSRVQDLQQRGLDVNNKALTGWARRPTAWLFLIDVGQIRGTVKTGFGFQLKDDPNVPGGQIAYDTGAAFFEEVCQRGLKWASMSDGWSDGYHHFGGMTWTQGRRPGLGRRSKRALKRLQVRLRLQRARVIARTPMPSPNSSDMP